MHRLKNKWVRRGLVILILGSIVIGIAAKGCLWWRESSSKAVVGSSAPVGSLIVSLGSNDPGIEAITNTQTSLVMVQVSITATAVEDITISDIAFTGTGTAHEVDDIDTIYLYLDADNDGVSSTGDTQIDATPVYDGDNGTVTFSGVAQTISAGTSVNWILVYDLPGAQTASDGETFIAGLASNTDVTATGDTSGQSITPSGAPFEGGTKTVTP